MKLTLPPTASARCSLSSRRFSSRSLTGRVRTEVAVGTVRLRCMFSTRRAAGPRKGWATGAAGWGSAGTAGAAGAVAGGAALAAGVAAGASTGAAGGAAGGNMRSAAGR